MRGAGVDQQEFVFTGMFVGRYGRSGRNLLGSYNHVLRAVGFGIDFQEELRRWSGLRARATSSEFPFIIFRGDVVSNPRPD